jgi:hypothetical protein
MLFLEMKPFQALILFNDLIKDIAYQGYILIKLKENRVTWNLVPVLLLLGWRIKNNICLPRKYLKVNTGVGQSLACIYLWGHSYVLQHSKKSFGGKLVNIVTFSDVVMTLAKWEKISPKLLRNIWEDNCFLPWRKTKRKKFMSSKSIPSSLKTFIF